MFENLDTKKILANAGAAGAVGTFLPDILSMVPPKYHAYVSAGIAIFGMLSALFQKAPHSTDP